MSHDLNNPQQREKTDPNEDSIALPWFITMMIGALLMWGAMYIYGTVMSTSPEQGDNQSSTEILVSSESESIKVAIDGGAIFQSQCAACHQAAGQGIPGVFPPLAESEWVNGKPEVLINILLHGVNGKLNVKNIEYNGQMPAFKDKFKDNELAALLSYIRSAWGNKADAVDVNLISSVREDTNERDDPYNGDDELSAL
jgi:mono/diheme cytochrome c family protein